MVIFIFLPFLIQAIAIGIDESYFHLKRGLPKWERIGHPLDTLSILLCFGFISLVPFSITNLKIYIALSLFSCFLVTKDEFVHKHHCPAAEQWLHALLFVNHPLVLGAAGVLWPVIQGYPTPDWISNWLCYSKSLQVFMAFQTWITFAFFLYQIIYWNVLWKRKKT